MLLRAQKLRHQDIPELQGKVQKLEFEATQLMEASMVVQDDHRAAQEAQQVLLPQEHMLVLPSSPQEPSL